jgi:NAD(P)H-hydrate epimerase
MKYAVNSEKMKIIDDYTVQVCNIPALDLMERAADRLAAVMKQRIDKADMILAVCGPGNNGGDGVAAGRILYLQGYHVAILFIGDEEKASPSMKAQLEMAGKISVPRENRDRLHEYNIIIDALFGVGLTRDITGVYEEVIRQVNEADNIVYAVDIPSGISADSGKVMNIAVRAEYTVTFGHQKQGLLLYPGVEYAGMISVEDIGFPLEATKQAIPDTFYYEPDDLAKLPPRRNYSNKGTYGRVLVIAGSKGMSGAAYLSAKAAYRTGAGLVKVLTSEENRVIIQTLLPEALFSAYDDAEMDADERFKKLQEEIGWASAIVVGPGLGQSGIAHELVETAIRKAKVPVIIDADGITFLAKKLDHACMVMKETESFTPEKIDGMLQEGSNEAILQKRIDYLSELLPENTILTPHLLELSRLIGIPVSEIANNLIDTAHQCSYNNKLIYVIKDARTIVAQSDLRYINVSGNNGMATGGSGDVLTGIIAGLIAQGKEPYEAACLAVYIHGLAGDAAARDKGVYSMMASDIINSIETVIKQADTDCPDEK